MKSGEQTAADYAVRCCTGATVLRVTQVVHRDVSDGVEMYRVVFRNLGGKEYIRWIALINNELAAEKDTRKDAIHEAAWVTRHAMHHYTKVGS